MKRVIFKSLSVCNFLSTGAEPVELKMQNGVCLVTGYNFDKDSRNGVGKSALLVDALFFALFGTAMRNIGKSKLPNRKGTGRPRVECEFDVITPHSHDTYLLTRAMKPSRLFISKNGEDLSRTIAKSTKEIESIIDASPDVFRNCVIMSMNQTKPFMGQRRNEKRKFIEGILKLDVFSDMLMTVRKEINETSKELDRESAVYGERDSTHTNFCDQQSKETDNRRLEVTELKARISANEATMSRILSESRESDKDIDIKKIDNKIALITKQHTESEALTHELIAKEAQLVERIKSLETEIASINETPTVCPTCKRPWEEDSSGVDAPHIHELSDEIEKKREAVIDLKPRISDIREALTLHRDVISRCIKGIRKLRNHKEDYNRQVEKNAHASERITQMQDFNEQLDKDIEKVKHRGDQYVQLIEDALQRLQETKAAVNNLEYELMILDNVKFVVSEEGVKSYIVKKMLKLFNSRLAYYLEYFSAACSCTFDEYFGETISDEDGNDCDYDSFSAGEQKRIDLAMLFTFQDIRRLQSDTSVNVSVYDELFDSSLDTAGVQRVLELLKERSDKFNEATYVVTHRADAAKLTEGVALVHLEKRNGITTIGHYESNI